MNNLLVIKKEKKLLRGDYFIPISVILLSLIGTIFIYSASCYSALATYNDSYYFVKKQLLGIGLGIAAMLFTCNFNYERLKKFSLPLSLIAIVLLCLVFVPGVGVENYGAKRWIGFGGLTLQPSEISKFSLILIELSFKIQLSFSSKLQIAFIGRSIVTMVFSSLP